MMRALSLSLLLAAVGGCTVGKNFVPPTPQAPPHWPEQALSVPAAAPGMPGAAPAAGVVAAEDDVQLAWWRGFEDSTLSRLIERGRETNMDVRAALLRVQEARAQREVSAAQYWPNLSLDTSFSRQRLSQSTPTGALIGNVGNIRVPGFPAISIPNPYNQYQLSADASWELDLFGRVRRAVEVADANVQVSVEDQHAVLEAALADIAQNYIELRGAQARLRVARDNLSTTDELLQLTQQRNAAGLTTYIDVSNAAAQAEVTRAELPAIELQITQNINQLSQLLGREPEALRPELAAEAPMPPLPSAVPVGVPAQLARRRPDIREAEASLHAATAQQGVAMADLFPRLTVSAGGGYQSETAGELLEWASRFGSFGPALDLPVFDRGRWKSLRLYDVRAQEAALSYQAAVLQALHEVDNAATALGTDQQRRAWLLATVADNRDALTLSRQRYESGLTNFIDVLDAERTLQQNQLSLVDSTTAVSTDLVRLYRALGGGWQAAQGAPGLNGERPDQH
ncbi:MAG TPA: efflux transporter outer membrane subunit [Steroidobacteraceae bacterium]|jgi:NodT family efflux transporter outer membrane factor (OMF) lipoprotein